jgi:hypothetical protein
VLKLITPQPFLTFNNNDDDDKLLLILGLGRRL